MPKNDGKMLTTVLIAEEQRNYAVSDKKNLKEEPPIAVVGESESFAETVQLVSELKPPGLHARHFNPK
jgi:hypothetical protein